MCRTYEEPLNDRVIMEADLGSEMWSTVFLAFPVLVPPEGGIVKVIWKDDLGQMGETQQRLVL